ncbi:ABC transporter substrate-binding protein [Robbsia andropogonis]|uniref:ABC transporter substrate-binding protein n=2 Tax=Robbsia andropogonis TaxID=28092 RepID=A0A0F5JUC5_9BURK|nr:ABC transporter substrate-binding protein [Robbsia andropogonis]KKB61446.1 ABC transporter substrate-binding protein [Robbsia andropogonis]MCP1121058.1 ABC transporter substrate-binding protein [Robbsia andropogonis]MCP1130851.1 ABC transporter substrate-binding protein [Robbsia andropogonis]
MRKVKCEVKVGMVLAAAVLYSQGAFAQSGQTLRIGIQDDIGTLDPAKSTQVVERMVFNSLCSSLVDITPDLKIVPKLATSWSQSADGKTLTFKLRHGATFQDGEPFNAAAVKANLDRYRTMPSSNRRSELASVDSVDVVSDDTVAIKLKAPDAALLATLTDRAGMMLAPKTLGDAAGVAAHPVCSGPYKFVERVQNDRVVLEKWAGYWDAAAYPIEKVIFQPMPDTTVRLANLRSGSLDMLERLAPSDVAAVKSAANLQLVNVSGLGEYNLTYNIANGKGATAALKDKRVRQAFELAIDRDAINKIIGGGIFAPANQAIPPSSPYFNAALPMTKRDVTKAKALLKEAGYTHVDVELTFGNNTVSSQMAQMLQAMVSEAGINLKLRPTDYAAALNAAHNGDFQVMYLGWSGRTDPDGNLHQFVTCNGNLNYGHYCNAEVDKLLNEARTKQDVASRKPLYDAAQKILADEDPLTYLYYQPWPFALSKKVQGFVAYPDGLIRLRGVSIKG